jgi:VIT1/CCC1 family predicted Fe2+/Mn2+ transporter
MKLSVKKGVSFGLTSGIITTLGLIVGLFSNTHSSVVIISGILVIAIADAMSDALGIHVSQESEKSNTEKEVWESTLATFLSKFFIALSFVLPILFLPLNIAVVACILWGIFLLITFNYYIAKQKNVSPAGVIFEHLTIAIIVIIVTYYVGELLK